MTAKTSFANQIGSKGVPILSLSYIGPGTTAML